MMKKQNFKKMFGMLLCMCMLFSSFTERYYRYSISN